MESHVKTHSFSKLYFNNAAIWNRDIDRYRNTSIVSTIYSHTTLETNEIESLFLDSLKGILYNSDNNSYSILDIGINHRKRKGYGQMYCPGCLQNQEKFFRRHWRLSSSLVCLECGIMLYDRCPHCLNPISFHRLENGYKNLVPYKSLDTCSYCMKKLYEFDFQYADSRYIAYQAFVSKTLELGFNNLCNYSFQYFDVLNSLHQKLYSESKNWNKIRIAIENDYAVVFESYNKHSYLERKKSFYICYELLENWPYNFSEFIRRHNFIYTDFSKDSKNLPFWFIDQIRENI